MFLWYDTNVEEHFSIDGGPIGFSPEEMDELALKANLHLAYSTSLFRQYFFQKPYFTNTTDLIKNHSLLLIEFLEELPIGTPFINIRVYKKCEPSH